MVHDLRPFAGVDDDALDDVQEVVRVQEVVVEGQDLGADVEFVEDAAFVGEGEDAVCEVAFEVVAAGPGACAREADDLFFCFARFRWRKAVRYYDVALLQYFLDVCSSCCIGW